MSMFDSLFNWGGSGDSGGATAYAGGKDSASGMSYNNAPLPASSSQPSFASQGGGDMISGTIGALGNIWGAMQANKLAKKQFKFTKQMANINLNNQIKSYNTALTDRITSRTVAQNQDEQVGKDYLTKHSLSR